MDDTQASGLGEWGATHKERKFKSKNFVNEKHEFHFVHTELKFILGNANVDFLSKSYLYGPNTQGREIDQS